MKQAGQALVHSFIPLFIHSFLCSFIHLFNHYLVRLYYLPGPILGVRVNKAELVTTL